MSFLNFTVNKPLKGHDEDAPAYADDKLLIVCDGLGGGGQNSYLIDGEKRTSAYLGSRRISLACQEYLLAHYDEFCSNMQNPETMIAGLKSYITESLDHYVAENGLKNIVRGKSMQMLPSTLAAILYKPYKDRTEALVISAGDSRAFVLTPDKGLQQISKDDVFDNVDAFDKSATMTNNIRQDGEYHINYAYYTLPPKCILLVCTDGCFDYISNPMELEFRLEYSISKCGDLFDKNRDALGEYFGDVLVKSGLKDDCTMAGVILGYTDSEKTQSLFLQRALQVQEKYRNPCALYDKESLKRKSEVEGQIPAIESKVTELRTQIDATIKKSILEAFNLEQQSVGGYIPESLKETVLSLREFELYRAFIEELEKAESNAKKNAEEKTTEYTDLRSHIQQIFKSMRFDEFVNGLLTFNPVNFFNSDRSRFANEYKRLKQLTNEYGQKYVDALAEFSKVFEEFKSVEPKMHLSVDELTLPSLKFRELQFAYNEYISTKQELKRCKENLKSFYMENDFSIEQEFISAWKRGFSAYNNRPQYAELRSEYDRCIELQREIESCTVLTFEQKQKKFNEYLEEHLAEFVNRIKSNTYLSRLICGSLMDEITAFEKQLNELKKYGSEFDEKKYALWLEYKPVYELYNHCIGGKL